MTASEAEVLGTLLDRVLQGQTEEKSRHTWEELRECLSSLLKSSLAVEVPSLSWVSVIQKRVPLASVDVAKQTLDSIGYPGPGSQPDEQGSVSQSALSMALSSLLVDALYTTFLLLPEDDEAVKVKLSQVTQTLMVCYCFQNVVK